jgi:hypothetical protein
MDLEKKIGILRIFLRFEFDERESSMTRFVLCVNESWNNEELVRRSGRAALNARAHEPTSNQHRKTLIFATCPFYVCVWQCARIKKVMKMKHAPRRLLLEANGAIIRGTELLHCCVR